MVWYNEWLSDTLRSECITLIVNVGGLMIAMQMSDGHKPTLVGAQGNSDKVSWPAALSLLGTPECNHTCTFICTYSGLMYALWTSETITEFE